MILRSSLRTRISSLLCLLLLHISNSWIVVVNAAYIIEIQSGDEECYYMSHPKGKALLFGNFEQLDDNPPGQLVMVVMDVDKEKVVYRSKVAGNSNREGTFSVNLKDGQKTSICFQNGLNTRGRQPNKQYDDLSRTVGFQFAMESRTNEDDLKKQSSRLVQSTRDLTRELSTLESHHEYMRTREALHREVVEQTFSTLLLWAILEAVVLIGVATGQVMYFRRFLESRRYI